MQGCRTGNLLLIHLPYTDKVCNLQIHSCTVKRTSHSQKHALHLCLCRNTGSKQGFAELSWALQGCIFALRPGPAGLNKALQSLCCLTEAAADLNAEIICKLVSCVAQSES